MEEHELIERAQRGDTRAFEQLVLRYQRSLFRFLHGFGLRSDKVEEIAQEALLKAYKNLNRYSANKGARFATWLFVIAKRLMINELGKREHRQPQVDLEHAMSLASDAPTPAETLAGEQERQQVLSALQQVKEPFRSALLFSYIEELTLSEIAHIEQCSIGTVKSRIHRGKQILYGLLTQTLGLEP